MLFSTKKIIFNLQVVDNTGWLAKNEMFYKLVLMLDVGQKNIHSINLTLKEQEVSVLYSDPRCKDGNAIFTTVTLKPLFKQ